MKEMAMMNAMRSALVVVGAAAFGNHNYHLGFKPFLEKAAQEQNQPQLSQEPTAQQVSHDDKYSDDSFKMEVRLGFNPFFEKVDEEQNQPRLSEEPTTQQASDEKLSDDFE